MSAAAVANARKRASRFKISDVAIVLPIAHTRIFVFKKHLQTLRDCGAKPVVHSFIEICIPCTALRHWRDSDSGWQQQGSPPFLLFFLLLSKVPGSGPALRPFEVVSSFLRQRGPPPCFQNGQQPGAQPTKARKRACSEATGCQQGRAGEDGRGCLQEVEAAGSKAWQVAAGAR